MWNWFSSFFFSLVKTNKSGQIFSNWVLQVLLVFLKWNFNFQWIVQVFFFHLFFFLFIFNISMSCSYLLFSVWFWCEWMNDCRFKFNLRLAYYLYIFIQCILFAVCANKHLQQQQHISTHHKIPFSNIFTPPVSKHPFGMTETNFLRFLFIGNLSRA